MIKKEKTVEQLLRNYRENKSELQMLSYGLDLQAIRYDKDRVQTSNKYDLSDLAVARENRLMELMQDVDDTENLLNALKDRDRFIIESFYIKGIKRVVIASKIGLNTEDAVTKAKDVALGNMEKFYDKIKEYRRVG